MKRTGIDRRHVHRRRHLRRDHRPGRAAALSPGRAGEEGLPRGLPRPPPCAGRDQLSSTARRRHQSHRAQRGEVGLVTTAGFRDVRRESCAPRGERRDLHWKQQAPLVPRLAGRVTERVDARGFVWVARQPSCAALVARCCARVEGRRGLPHMPHFQHEHEQRVAAIIAEMAPRIPVSVSGACAAKFAEYERASTIKSMLCGTTRRNHIAKMDAACHRARHRYMSPRRHLTVARGQRTDDARAWSAGACGPFGGTKPIATSSRSTWAGQP
jgi:hypothetical protein